MRDLLTLTSLTLFFTFLVWLPHFLNLPNFWGLSFNEGFSTIYRNFDGLEYIVIAKTFYNPSLIAGMPLSLPANYYAAHFPGFALALLPFALILGFLKSMLFVSLLFTVFSSWVFYFLIKDFKLTNHPLLLSIIFLILPGRWVIVHSVGSAEPLFIFFVLLSIYFFMKYELINKSKWLWYAALAGMGAQITRPPGILLAIAYFLYILYIAYLNTKTGNKNFVNIFKYFPLLLIPLTLFAVFYMFQISYGDFWAYFHSGDNIHLTFPPFQVFNKNQAWVGEIWLEDIIYIFTLSFFGASLLFKQKLYPMAFFALTYLTASTFVAHRDISRYVLPIFPFLLISFERFLTSKEFKIILPIVALAIYLYSQNFLLANTAPIPDLKPFN